MTLATAYDGYTPMSIEYQGHTVRRGWYQSGRRTWSFGNVWYCHGAAAPQSRWCRLCCERNGWVYVDPYAPSEARHDP